ncbi:MAG: hypothetical protein OEX13_17935, partial [Gammaproteobacteria bacterium]|nr:hypothetical protein [Gammaproteobacteria bacterium]
AAERIGAETVGYVANIFKYHVGFELGFRKSEVGEEIKDALRNQVGRTRYRDHVRTARLAVSTLKVRPGASTLM